jgi:putative ABC transport system permease protein
VSIAATRANGRLGPPGNYRRRAVDLHRASGGHLDQAVPTALEALAANKGRSALTSLGIIIGVAAVIVMISVGQGASAQVSQRLQGLGTNVITVMPGSGQRGGVQAGAGSVSTLTESDADAILVSVPGVLRLSPVINGNAQVIAGNRNWQTRVSAVRPDFQLLQNWSMAAGSFFSAADNASSDNVAVIGQTVANNLFTADVSPVGQSIRIRTVPFIVIGVLASKGGGGFQDQDDVILIPYETGQIRLFGINATGQILVQASDANQVPAMRQDIESLLRERHRLATDEDSDFSIRTSNEIVDTASGVTQTLTLLLAGVASVSLVVGGIGIMNIMLFTVSERTREIGIRLAIGARPGDVLLQFLVEAVVLSISGGILGILLGMSVSLVVPILAQWPTVVSLPAIALAFGFSVMVGVFFGIYPARKASRLNPIDALRYE